MQESMLIMAHGTDIPSQGVISELEMHQKYVIAFVQPQLPIGSIPLNESDIWGKGGARRLEDPILGKTGVASAMRGENLHG